MVHAGDPVTPGFARIRRIAHIHGHEDVIGEAVEQRRDISPASASVPDAVDAAAVNRHEADAPRGLRRGVVIDREPSGPVARGIFLLSRAHHLAELALVIGLLGVAYIDTAKALGEHVADIGVAVMHHDLHAIGPAALVGVADDAHAARVI